MKKIIGIGLVVFLASLAGFFIVEDKLKTDRSQPLAQPDTVRIEQPTIRVQTPNEELLQLASQLHGYALAQAEQATKTPFAAPGSVALAIGPFEQFSTTTYTAAKDIDRSGGPADLACIFRGMSDDAAKKLLAIMQAKNMGQQAPLWREAADLFADVPMVLNPGSTPKHSTAIYGGETCEAGID